jgi:hypothetical protein
MASTMNELNLFKTFSSFGRDDSNRLNLELSVGLGRPGLDALNLDGSFTAGCGPARTLSPAASLPE